MTKAFFKKKIFSRKHSSKLKINLAGDNTQWQFNAQFSIYVKWNFILVIEILLYEHDERFKSETFSFNFYGFKNIIF